MALIGILFILDFRVPKLGFKWILAAIALVAMVVGMIFVYSSFRAPDNAKENNEIMEAVQAEEEGITEIEPTIKTDADIRAQEEENETELEDGSVTEDVTTEVTQ